MKLVWTRSFQAELDEAVDFLALESPSAARRLVERLARTLKILSAHPLSGRTAHDDGDIRMIVSGKFRVWYRHDERTRVIELLYFRHGARLSPWQLPPADEEE